MDTTITVSKEMAQKLNRMKYELGCRTIEDLLERILKITSASELKKEAKQK